jgi:branched-chain amino acid transport system substrate-binding protein
MSRKTSWSAALLVILLLIGLLTLVGCDGGTTTSTTGSSSSETTTAGSETTSASEAETIKIGLEANLSSNVSLDWIHAVELQVEEDNKNGGLDIGGTKYKIELITYDGQGDQNKEVAAINKLVYEDKVKYIICEGAFAGAWLPITEKEKVVVFGAGTAHLNLSPNNPHYFNASLLDPMVVVVSAWYFEQHPEAKDSYVNAYPDDQFGHMVSGLVGYFAKSVGATSKDEFFPPNSQDLSALGTKVTSMNPKVFGCVTEGDSQSGLVFNAVRQAGYTGQFLNANVMTTEALKQVMSPEALEGFITAGMPTEFDPPLTDVAKQFKELWTAKYGEWTSPAIGMCSPYWALRAAFAQAASIDVEAVTTALGGGLKFESPMGSAQMLARPDLGIDKTIDSIGTYYIKQVKNGESTLLATVGVDEATKIFLAANPPAAAPAGGATPSGPPTEITFDQAAQYMDKGTLVSVTGQVADTMSPAAGVVVAFVGGPMGQGLAISVSGAASLFPGDIAAEWKGKTITVVGVVTKDPMAGQPTIAVTDAKQVTIK